MSLAAAAATDGHGAYGAPMKLGVVRSAELSEVSGLVASRRASGVFWLANDGGHPAAVHAINRRGRVLARVTLRGATNVDWEDLANGPGRGAGATIYVADFGDNTRSRPSARVYIFQEPRLSGAIGDRLERSVRAVGFRYPDGPQNAEALVVDPRSGRAFIFTKSLGRARVYRFPRRLPTNRVVTLTRIPASRLPGMDRVSLVTGADVSPDGARLVLRSYFRAWEFNRASGKGLMASLRHAPAPVSLPIEPQGEAIAYARNGGALITTSEGTAAPLWRIPLKG